MEKLNELFDKSKFVLRNLPDQTEFEETLKPELSSFLGIIEESFNITLDERAKKKPNSIGRGWDATTMSGNIKGLLIDNFPDKIKFDPNGRFYYSNSKYVIYFKKLNDGLLPSNINTNYNQKIYGQYALPLEKPLPIIFVGYTVNKSQDILTGTYAVCIKDQIRLWVTDLSKFNSISQLSLTSQPIPLPDDLSSLIKIKGKKSS